MRASVVVYVAAAVLALCVAWKVPRRAEVPPGPPRVHGGEYVSSNACRSCHPAEHASWQRTFHRTMTQRATADTVRAPMDAAAVGRAPVALTRRGTRVWSRVDGRDLPLVLTTGSHHYQVYWVDDARPGELRALPYVWMLAERRWIPRRDAFLDPPDAPSADVHWSSNCIACHAVGGEPARADDRATFDPAVAELGIACEACHGPGAEHVARYHDPVERVAARARRGPDPTIVNPARIPPARSVEVCGQCHAYAYPRDEDEWWRTGYRLAYRPGDELERSRTLLSLARLRTTGAPTLDASEEGLYWKDGTMRVGGREANGFVLSACFTKGEGTRKATCLSCHAMHDSEPDDQLARDRPGDEPCLRCHEDLRDVGRASAHTHHPAGSPGAACVACHMPKTSYALLGAIRSHRIDSPRAETARATGRPLACNLCHLDRSLAWSAAQLAVWRSAGPAPADPAPLELPAAVELALRGDAADRVIVASAFGDADALRASGTAWEWPVLEKLLDDPYAAVRWVAARSLASYPWAQGVAVDPEAPEAVRRAQIARVGAGAPKSPLDPAAMEIALRARDARPITISE